MCDHHHQNEIRKAYSRRFFLKTGGLALLASGIGGVPNFIARAAGSPKLIGPYKKNKILVCIFQRGAMDGLAAVTPFNDKWLREARPSLFLDPSIQSGNGMIDLDGRFGLHSGMTSFGQLFKEKQLAVIHGVGSPNTTRSHFDAQDYMETGTPFSKGTASGWLNRAVGLMGHEGSPFRAMSLTQSLPRSFYGDNPAVAISNLADFSLQVRNNPVQSFNTARGFESLYDKTTNELLQHTGQESFEAMKMLGSAKPNEYRPSNGAVYPTSTLGNALKQIAQLIKMDVGVEVAFTECGGWDTHVNQGSVNGLFARNVRDLSTSIAAFWQDLDAYHDEVSVLTMTEFGRTVKQNGTGGTDHGRASCMFLLGNDVNGGLVHGKVPELAMENLEDQRDLPVTTDFRSVFNEIARQHLGIGKNTNLFPGFDGKEIGVMRT